MNRNRYIFNLIAIAAVAAITLIPGRAKAQQDPLYSMYNFNIQSYNPAYAGTWERPGFLVTGRQQWVGFDGAPNTYAISLQTPFRSKNVGLGFNVIDDRLGFERRLLISADYSYRLQVGSESFLRLGLKGGVTNYSLNFRDYVGFPGDTPDPQFATGVDVKYMPNFGVGAFLYSDNYYLGLAIPKMLQNQFEDNYNNFSVSAELRHFFFQGGYVFDLANGIRFKPTFLTRAVVGAPIDVDLSGNLLLADRFWIGATYRFQSAYGFVAQWMVAPNFRIGYSQDINTTSLRSYQNGTHEVMVSYEFAVSKRIWSTPRAF